MQIRTLPILFVCRDGEYGNDAAKKNARFLAEKITGIPSAKVFFLPHLGTDDDYNRGLMVTNAAYDDSGNFSCIVLDKNIGKCVGDVVLATCQIRARVTLKESLLIFRCLDEWGELGLMVPETTTIPVFFEHAETAVRTA